MSAGNIFTDIVKTQVNAGNYGGRDGAWGKYADAGKKKETGFRIYRFSFNKGEIFEGTDPNGLSDGYIKVFIIKKNEKGEEKKKLFFKTPVCKKTLNPTWGYSELFTVKNSIEKVLIELWDDDLIKDDFIGRAKVKLTEASSLMPFVCNLNVLNDDNKHTGTVSTIIQVVDDNGTNRLACKNWKK